MDIDKVNSTDAFIGKRTSLSLLLTIVLLVGRIVRFSVLLAGDRSKWWFATLTKECESAGTISHNQLQFTLLVSMIDVKYLFKEIPSSLIRYHMFVFPPNSIFSSLFFRRDFPNCINDKLDYTYVHVYAICNILE